MLTYVVRRLLHSVLLLGLVSLAIFTLVRSLPAETILLQLTQTAALNQTELLRARQELGLDRPFWQQYMTWLSGTLQGHLGYSLTSQQLVTQELGKRLGLTLHLLGLALMMSLLLAIPVGLVSALWHNTCADYLGKMLAIAGLACPDFWLATVAMVGMTLWWHWVPAGGFAPLWVDPRGCLTQLLLPALLIGARLSALLIRVTRSALLDVLRQDYIRTARAKGLSAGRLITRHGCSNAGIPVVRLIRQQCSRLLGGVVLVEVVFLLPGVGSLTLDAVMLHDYTMIQGAVMFFAGAMVGVHLLLDLAYAWLAPYSRST